MSNNNKMKGLLKGLRYISQIFDNEKEPEMQIGYPTDVKHVAHIGWDGPSVNSPSWMNEFQTPSGVQAAPVNANGQVKEDNAVKWVSEDSSSRRGSRSRGTDSTSRDLPELPKSSRRHSSLSGGAGDSPTMEKLDKPSNKQSRRSSRNANKELADGKLGIGRQKDGSQSGEAASNSINDAPKKGRRKKSKDSSGSTSKTSRSKANASDVDCASESGSVSKSLTDDNCDTASTLSAVDEDAEHRFNEVY